MSAMWGPSVWRILFELVRCVEAGYYDPARFGHATVGAVDGREWLSRAKEYIARKGLKYRFGTGGVEHVATHK